MKSEPCGICGGTDTNLVDGYYYCVECGTQDMTIMETVIESGVLQDGTYAVAAKRKINKKKVAFQMSGEWYKWHAYNFILSGIADELISLGASPSFKRKLLWIWILYIKKFHHREDYDKNNLTQQNSVLDSCQSDSNKVEVDDDNDGDQLNDDEHYEDQLNEDDADDDEKQNDDHDNDDDDDDKSSNKKGKKQGSLSTMTFTILYAMMYCALNLDKSDIQASDVVRFIREGRLSKKSAVKYVPKELNLSTIPQWPSFIKSYATTFNLRSLLRWSCTLFKELDLGTPVIPNLGNLVTRYCKELCLPKEFRQLAMSLIELIPPDSCCKEIWQNNLQIPQFEVTVMAYIVIGLKMCFGLDDDYDQKLTYTVNEINDEENHLKAYRIGLFEPTERLFSFGEWLKYLEFRKLLLCKYYQPMSIIHQAEINSCLITESLKDLMKYEKRLRRDEMTCELLNKIPQDNDFDILPKEGFPASLTPLTVYTEHVLLNAKVEDSRIKLLLSEDFSKYSLNYACVDLKLKYSSVSENIIRGVEEINEDVAKIVTNPLNSTHLPNNSRDTRLSFVIDSENNNVLGNYAVVESASGDYVEVEMINEEAKDADVPNDNEIEEINSISELDEDSNIFGVNFDTTDSHSQDHLHVNDFHCEDRDDTVFDLLNNEYDSQNFNREDVIRNLILRQCSKYKIPKPFEYKYLTKTVKKTEKDDNKNNEDKPRKPKEVYSGVFNSNNILDMYKKALDKMAQDAASAPREIEESEGSNDSNINNNLSTNSELQPNSEFTFERTEELTNTDGMELVPTVETSAPMDITDVLFNVNEADESFTATLEVPDAIAVDTEENPVQSLEVLQNIDINDILLAEIKKYEEEAKQGNKIEPEFSKKDDIPLANLFGKKRLKLRDRSHMKPLLTNPEGVNNFNYYILRYLKKLILNVQLRSYSFEKEMLANFPRSFRYVLQTCACIVEVNSYQLFRILQILEENFINMDFTDFCSDNKETV